MTEPGDLMTYQRIVRINSLRLLVIPLMTVRRASTMPPEKAGWAGLEGCPGAGRFQNGGGVPPVFTPPATRGLGASGG